MAIPRFTARRFPLTRPPDWPPFDPPKEGTVFSERPPLRKLRVVLDYQLLAEVGDRPSPASHLIGLLTHDFIERMFYDDDGPPADAAKEEHPTGERVPGWLCVGPIDSADEFVRAAVTWSLETGSTVTRSAIHGNALEVARDDRRTNAYADHPETQAPILRQADATAALAADATHADLFITRRPYLLAVSWPLAGDLLCASPESALPIVGLYLRAQGEFIVDRSLDGTGTSRFDRDLYFWEATRDLLPAGWSWFSAIVHYSLPDEDGTDDFLYLGQSLFSRAQRALEARDQVHRALNQKQDNSKANDALDALDRAVIALMSAVDVSARVAHRVLGLGPKEWLAGWQRQDWLDRVSEKAPKLAAVVGPRTRGQAALTVLRLLRNSIHGAALDALSVSGSGQHDRTMVGLPHSEALQVAEAMDVLGGRETFGVEGLLTNRLHADPGLLIDALLPEVIALLNSLMHETPVDRLICQEGQQDADGSTAGLGYPRHYRKHIRWQLGL